MIPFSRCSTIGARDALSWANRSHWPWYHGRTFPSLGVASAVLPPVCEKCSLQEWLPTPSMLLRREFGHWKVVFLEHGQERVHVNRMVAAWKSVGLHANPLLWSPGLGRQVLRFAATPCTYALKRLRSPCTSSQPCRRLQAADGEASPLASTSCCSGSWPHRSIQGRQSAGCLLNRFQNLRSAWSPIETLVHFVSYTRHASRCPAIDVHCGEVLLRTSEGCIRCRTPISSTCTLRRPPRTTAEMAMVSLEIGTHLPDTRTLPVRLEIRPAVVVGNAGFLALPR